MRLLDGKTAIVTGAAQGVGFGVAKALANAGAKVALFDIQTERLEQAAAALAAADARALAVTCDITVRDQVDAAVARVAGELGAATILVNNAIAVINGPLVEVDRAQLDLVMQTGPYASVWLMQACFPAMKAAGWGRIINFGSGGATMGMAGLAAYSIAKEGIRGLTKVAASEWGQWGITVNAVCPNVASPLRDKWYASLPPEERQRETELIPIRRTVDAETEVGATIVFLASPGGGGITGRTLHVDGGRAYYDR